MGNWRIGDLVLWTVVLVILACVITELLRTVMMIKVMDTLLPQYAQLLQEMLSDLRSYAPW